MSGALFNQEGKVRFVPVQIHHRGLARPRGNHVLPEPMCGLVAGRLLPGLASARLPLSWPFIRELGRNETNAAERKQTPGEPPLGEFRGLCPGPVCSR